MNPATGVADGQIQEPVSVDRLHAIDYDTDEFRENSVRILAAACERGPVCRVLPHDVPGLVRFRDVDAVLRDPLTFSSKISHRDSVLSEEEEAEGRKILACVSRGRKRLLLAI